MDEKDIKKMVKSSEELLEEVWEDPLVQEYFENQKKLFKATLKKAIDRAEKKYLEE